ncbi:MAG TPA: AI-2E family transporter [Solirubrobacterales bacterium]|nr:AI-2E family transporter [Solirubrobacterales bacterium]
MEKGARPDGHVVYRAVLLAAGLVVLALLFREMVTLLVAILITILVSIPIAAAATRLERVGVPRPVGALAAELGLIAAFAGLVALLLPTFIDQVEEFIDAVPGIVEDLEHEIAEITGDDPGEVGDELQDRLEEIVDDPGQLAGPIAAIGAGLAGVLAGTVLGLVTAYYIAVRPQPLVDGALSLFPPERREWARGVGERIRGAWIGWMKGAIVDMLLNGLMIYAGLSLIGLEFAYIFGVIAGLLTVVPYFGPIAASLPPILFALADSPEKALLVAVVFIVVQQIEGNITIPLVMAQTVRLHPAVIAVGVVIVGQLLGFIGLFVAVPLLSLFAILVDELWVKPRQAATGIAPVGTASGGGDPAA